MRIFPLTLLSLIAPACTSARIFLEEGEAVAVGGRASVEAHVSRGDCIQIIGDSCNPVVPIDEGEVRDPEIAQFVDGRDGMIQLEGLSEGEAAVRVRFTVRDRTFRRRAWFRVVEPQGLHADYDDDRLGLDESRLELRPGDSVAIRTRVHGESEWQELAADGLHTLRADNDLLTIEGDGGPEHVLTAGEEAGSVLVSSELLDLPAFEVAIIADEG
ncbi:MAG: hypothetical protein EA397_12490 [Deltaproteobacteria bacterium]|nr:MAG: hypothetical protein EA397_12490 [Deltaproteobacteria bacterium]